MITVLEQTPTGLQREGRPLYRRVYLVCGEEHSLPTDAAPGSVALVRRDGEVATRILFPDGVWGKL
jgi:hypothetical protein